MLAGMQQLGAAGGPPGPAAAAEPEEPVKMIELTAADKNLLEKSRCYARNEDSRYPWQNLLTGDTRIGCKSDADEQLIIHFEFTEFVKIHSVKLTELSNGAQPENNPTRVLLFVNRNDLGFEDVDDVDPTTTLELTAEDLRETADGILLRYVNYQRVKTVTLYIEDNNGGEISSLGKLQFFGKPVATTNMKDFKKQG